MKDAEPPFFMHIWIMLWSSKTFRETFKIARIDGSAWYHIKPQNKLSNLTLSVVFVGEIDTNWIRAHQSLILCLSSQCWSSIISGLAKYSITDTSGWKGKNNNNWVSYTIKTYSEQQNDFSKIIYSKKPCLGQIQHLL